MMFGFKRKAPTPNQSIETTITTAKSMADDLLRIGSPGQITKGDLTKAARCVADNVGLIYREKLAAKGMSPQLAELLAKPVEGKIFSEVRTYLHAKAPLRSMEVRGQA